MVNPKNNRKSWTRTLSQIVFNLPWLFEIHIAPKDTHLDYTQVS